MKYLLIVSIGLLLGGCASVNTLKINKGDTLVISWQETENSNAKSDSEIADMNGSVTVISK